VKSAVEGEQKQVLMFYEHVCVFVCVCVCVFNSSMITQFKITLANELESSVYDYTFRSKSPYTVDSQGFGILTYK